MLLYFYFTVLITIDNTILLFRHSLQIGGFDVNSVEKWPETEEDREENNLSVKY